MADIKHFRNGVQVNPRGFEDLKITMDWLNRKSEASINVESLTFVGFEGAALVERLLDGQSGGVGFFEGEPYQLQVGDNAFSLDAYLDFTSGVQIKNGCEVTCNLKKKQSTDWLNDVADGFSFRYLYSIGLIKDSDFVGVPYTINYIPDGAQLAILSLSTYTLVKELIENIKSLSDRISDLTDAATPVVGVSAGVGAGVVTAYDIGNIIMAALKLIAQIAYLVAIGYALVKLTEQIIEQVMPPKRFQTGIPYRVLMQRGCDYLNLKLSSSLLDALDRNSQQWCYLPTKNHRGGEKPTGATNSWKELGVPNSGSSIDTFAGLIRFLKSTFNADFKIVDGTLYFERRDMFKSNSPYVIPNTFIDQDSLQDVNGFNTDEFTATYNINWATDTLDLNTLDNQEGRVFQMKIEPKNTNNPELTNLVGGEVVSLSTALAVRKDKLTVIEEVVKVFASLVDAVTGQLGKPSSFSGKIKNRIGSMHLSQHFIGTDKTVVLAGGLLAKNQRDIVSATNLWRNYHAINSFAPIDGIHNQYYIYKEQEIPFCSQDFVSLLSHNDIVTESGEKAEIELLEWDVWNNKAIVSYRINKLYDNNFNIVYL